jgi:hypothetical protein
MEEKEKVTEKNEFTDNNYWKCNNFNVVEDLADCLRDLEL